MHVVKGNNINEIQLSLYKLIVEQGSPVQVRNNLTKEIYPVAIELTNPSKRLTTLEQRQWNFPFAIGETAWHISGSNNFDFISYYSKNWIIAKEEGENSIRESCYGNQIFDGIFNQWKRLINELDDDINSRRAVISLYDSKTSLGLNKMDVACTSTIQFLVRNNRLNCIVNMRSNDVIWGTPNDIFFATLLQEWLSVILGIEMGSYYHNVGSLHAYERHFDFIQGIIDNPKFVDFEMPKMENVDDISEFLINEEKLRTGKIISHEMKGYWGDFLDILSLRSSKVQQSKKQKIINNSYYKNVLELCPSSYVFKEKLNYQSR